MAKDFEVHERGTANEIRLARKLVKAIDLEVKLYGEVVPRSVFNAYKDVVKFYKEELEMEIL